MTYRGGGVDEWVKAADLGSKGSGFKSWFEQWPSVSTLQSLFFFLPVLNMRTVFVKIVRENCSRIV